MRIVKLLLYGLFPCFLWSCEKEGTDQQYVEVPEGFALSAGTATNFLTSSKALIFKFCDKKTKSKQVKTK